MASSVATPLERALGTIAGVNDFLRHAVRWYPNLRTTELRLVLVHSGDVILPELGPELGRYAQRKLGAADVVVRYPDVSRRRSSSCRHRRPRTSHRLARDALRVAMRDDEALRFELCSSVSGVDYLATDHRRLHVFGRRAVAIGVEKIARHENAKRPGGGNSDQQDEGDLRPACEGHNEPQNFSGLSSA